MLLHCAPDLSRQVELLQQASSLHYSSEMGGHARRQSRPTASFSPSLCAKPVSGDYTSRSQELLNIISTLTLYCLFQSLAAHRRAFQPSPTATSTEVSGSSFYFNTSCMLTQPMLFWPSCSPKPQVTEAFPSGHDHLR